jgi:hypothetical protein
MWTTFLPCPPHLREIGRLPSIDAAWALGGLEAPISAR